MPGAIVTTRMPWRASSRAAGKVSAATPPLDAAYAALPDLAVERRNRGRVDDDAALGFRVGLELRHLGGHQAQQVERADQVYLDHPLELGEQHGAVAPDDALAGGDAGAAHEDPRRAVRGERPAQRTFGARRVADVALQPDRGTERCRGFCDPRRIDVEKRDAGALRNQHLGRRQAEARGRTGHNRSICLDLHDVPLLPGRPPLVIAKP